MINEKTTKKTILVLVLSMVLLISLLPSVVMADEDSEELTEIAIYEEHVSHSALMSYADEQWQWTSSGVKQERCTYRAWHEAYDRLGISLPLNWGNAATWASNARNQGVYPVDNNPSPNSIVCWGGGSEGWGHVAYVTGVDDANVYIREAGINPTNGVYYRDTSFSRSNQNRWSGYWLNGYIHLKSTATVSIKASVYSIHSALNNNLVLDVADGKKTNGTNIQTQDYHGGPAQRFNIEDRGGYFTIAAQCSGLLIDTAENSYVSGANIFTWSETGATGQHWLFEDAGNGYYYIRSQNGTYIDVTDGVVSKQVNIQACRFNGSNAQKWKLVEETRTITAGTYSVHSALNNNLVLDVADGKKTNGTNIQTQDYHGGPAQRFNIENRGGYYTISPQCSGLLLDTEGNSYVSGANIFTWNETSATGQRWIFVDAGDGYYYIRSQNGTYIDVTDGVASKQVNIQACRFNGSKAQKWKLVEETRTITAGTYSVHSALNNNLVLDVADGKKTDGTNIQTQEYHGGSAQRFKIENKGSYYSIAAQCSGLQLDTAGNSYESGANIFTWSETGATGQHWIFVDAGDGYYYIRSQNGTYIDVTDGVASKQVNIQACRFNGSKAQKWKLVHEHTLIKKDSVKATCSKAGSTTYWTCSGCGKYFSDKDGKNEISKDKTIVKATSHNFGSNEQYCKNGCGTKNPNYVATKGKSGAVDLKKKVNPLIVKVSEKTFKRSKLKKAKKFSIGVSMAQGKVTYTLDKKAKKAKIKVTAKGKVTVPKKCKTGTYKITVTAAGNKNYKAGKKVVTIIVR